MYSKKMKEITKPTKDINKCRAIVLLMVLLEAAINGISTFFLPAITECFKRGMMYLGIGLIFCTIWQKVILEIISKYHRRACDNLSIEISKYSLETTMNIAKKVEGRVYHNDGVERRLSTYEIVNNLKEYINKTFSFRDEVIGNIIYFITFVFTLIGSVYATLEMTSNGAILIVLLSICFVIIAKVSYEQFKQRRMYSKTNRKLRDKNRNFEDDFANIYPQNKKHQEFLSSGYRETSVATLIEKREISLKESNSYILRALVMTISLSIIVSISILSEAEFTFEVGMSIVALANMYNRIITYISSFVRKLQILAEQYAEKDSHTEIVEVIASEYVKVLEIEKNTDVSRPIDNFKLVDFSYSYKDNDGRPIQTVIADGLYFTRGESTLIYGLSGSGKTTFIKALTGLIAHENKILANNGTLVLNYLHNYLMYTDDRSLIGSNTLLYEIITERNLQNFDERRLIEILKGIKLYDSIMEKIKDTGKSVIDFLKESYKYKSSTGEYKRYALARALYNLTDKDDILILDEPIGNIDEENAENVIEFINDFVNRDKKRIVIIISHQVSITRKFCSQVIRIEKDNVGDTRVFRFVRG